MLTYETCQIFAFIGQMFSLENVRSHLFTKFDYCGFLSPKQAVKDQRLIYSGKLLTDNLHIRDVFRKVKETLFVCFSFILSLMKSKQWHGHRMILIK